MLHGTCHNNNKKDLTSSSSLILDSKLNLSPSLPMVDLLLMSRLVRQREPWSLNHKNKTKKERPNVEFESDLDLSLNSNLMLPKAKLLSAPIIAQQKEPWSSNNQKKKDPSSSSNPIWTRVLA